MAERHCARSRPTTGRGNAWVQLKIIAPKRQNMSGSLGRPNLREKAETIAGKLKCIGRWRSAKNRTSRPLRGLAPIDVQTALPRSRRHSSRNICRATSCNIIGDVRGVMSPGRAVSIPCWRRRGRPRANVRLATPLSHYSISATFSIGDFFAEHRRSTHGSGRFDHAPIYSNAFSKKVENHACAVALHAMYYNFVRIHQTLKVTPAMAAGVTDRLWEMKDLVEMLEAFEASRKQAA